MKRLCHRVIALLTCAFLLTVSFCASGGAESESFVDYAGSVALDMQSETMKQEVTVRTFVDGDTTHFNVPETVDPSGLLKARYIAVNTPESTGVIEEWGKKASSFTKEKLQSADSIIIESDDEKWNLDSTSSRYLVWVWYRPAGETLYRNLNIELLQNGLALANSAAQSLYGEACMAAVIQAKADKLHIYSGGKDPDYYYGSAIELTIKELRLHPEQYDGKKVAFSGVITINHNNAVFIEDYDEETGLYFGISAYYGYNLNGGGLEVLHVGNEARIVGTMQFYEAGHAWQVSGLNYRMMKPKDPGNIQKLSEGHSPAWREITPDEFNSDVTVVTEDGESVYPFSSLAESTSVDVKGLPVTDVLSDVEGSARYLCLGADQKIWVWLPTLQDADGQPLAIGDFTGKTIDARGIVVYSEDLNDYCVRAYLKDYITIHEQ